MWKLPWDLFEETAWRPYWMCTASLSAGILCVQYDLNFFHSPFSLIIYSHPIVTDTKGLLPSHSEAETHLSRSNSTSSTRKSLVSTSLWICCSSSSSFCRSSLDLSLSAAQDSWESTACLVYVMISSIIEKTDTTLMDFQVWRWHRDTKPPILGRLWFVQCLQMK